MLLPLPLPEVLTAISLLFFVYAIGIGTTTMAGMLIGHVLITLPFVFINVSAAMETCRPQSWCRTVHALQPNHAAVDQARRHRLPVRVHHLARPLHDIVHVEECRNGHASDPDHDYLRTNFTPEAAAVSALSIVMTVVVVVISEKLFGLRIHRF